jgi:hypothetical protein
MVTPALAGHFAQRGVALLPLRAGAQAFVDELASAPPERAQVVVGGSLGAPPRPVRARVRVSPSAQPYLEGHRLNGAVVVPVVQAVEWFARAVRAARPDQRLASLRNLEVRRGIRLATFADPGEAFLIRSREEAPPGSLALTGASSKRSTLALELVGPSGAVHYACSAELAAAATEPVLPGSDPLVKPWSGTIYDGRLLFHTGPFRAVREVSGLSAEGAAGTVAGVRELGWPDEPWATDPAALDAALQLAVLWGQQVLGGPSLPTGVGRLFWSGGPVSGPVRCVVRRNAVQRERAVCDLWLESGGRALAELRGVALHLRPDAQAQASVELGGAR